MNMMMMMSIKYGINFGVTLPTVGRLTLHNRKLPELRLLFLVKNVTACL
jgi:hypothetical protein